MPYREGRWEWRGHEINYSYAGAASSGSGESRLPVVAVHGFGGNCHHWRKLTADLCESHPGGILQLGRQ